jgi:hypothetical protein
MTLREEKEAPPQDLESASSARKVLLVERKVLRETQETLSFEAAPLSRNQESLFKDTTPLSQCNGRVFTNHHHQRRVIMSTTTKSTRRSTVSLKLPVSVPALITYAKGIVKGMTGNPSFPSPTPALTVVTAAIDELQTAETAAQARTKGAATTRNDKRTALVVLLQQLRASIQKAAAADPTNGAAIIQNAGVAVRKLPTHHARTFAAKPGAVSGVAKVVAQSAARRASYEWQYSTDGDKTWLAAPATLQAKTTVSGLQPGATVQFKYRPLTKTGEGDWSQPVSLLVQ